MNARKNAVVALAVSCMLVLGISACGGGSSNSDSSSNPGSSSSGISGKVTVWDPEYQGTPAYTKAVDEIDANFEKMHPGVTVDRIAQPPESYGTQIKTAFASHEVPDMMLMFPGGETIDNSKGLEPLNDRITPDMSKNVTLWEFGTPGLEPQGERFGVPFGINGFTFYYNKKLFAQAGLPTDFHPKTWSDVRKAGERLEKAGIQAFVGGDKDGQENLYWFIQGWETANTEQQGREMLENERPWTDPIVAAALAPQIEMVEAELYPADYFSTELIEGWSNFAEGKGAMTLGLWNGVGFWGEFNAKLGEKNVGTFMAPGADEVGTLPYYNMSIPKDAKNKEAAWALIEYTQSKEGMEILDKVGGLMPNRRDVSLPPGSPTQATELIELTRKYPLRVSMQGFLPAAIEPVLQAEANEVLQGRKSLSDAQNAVQEEAEQTAE